MNKKRRLPLARLLLALFASTLAADPATGKDPRTTGELVLERLALLEDRLEKLEQHNPAARHADIGAMLRQLEKLEGDELVERIVAVDQQADLAQTWRNYQQIQGDEQVLLDSGLGERHPEVVMSRHRAAALRQRVHRMGVNYLAALEMRIKMAAYQADLEQRRQQDADAEAEPKQGTELQLILDKLTAIEKRLGAIEAKAAKPAPKAEDR